MGEPALVRSEIEAGVLSVVLARPEKKNALTIAMYQALTAALAQAGADASIRAVLLESEGADFCAGNDIADFLALSQGRQPLEQSDVFAFLRALASCGKPLVAAVRGRAVGIGTTLLLHCDLVYVAEDALLSTPFVDLALVPEAASSLLLPARLGHARAFAMLALGEAIDGRTAAAWGLANGAMPAGEVAPRARAAARALADKPPEALQATKRLMRRQARLLAAMEEEGREFAERLRSAEAQARFRAFVGRRGA